MKSETRTVGLPVASCRLVMQIQSFHISDPGFSALPNSLSALLPFPLLLFRFRFLSAFIHVIPQLVPDQEAALSSRLR